MSHLTLVALSLLAGLREGLLQPSPSPRWTFGQRMTVAVLRRRLERVTSEPPPTQRAVLDRAPATPASSRPSGAIRFEPREAALPGTILYFHGGGYVIGRPELRPAYLQRMSDATRRVVISARYRLAPENASSAALEDAEDALNSVLEAGAAPGQVVLVGDSAGGGLALRLIHARRDRGEPSLAGAVLGSPWVDLASETYSNDRADYLTPAIVGRWARLCTDTPESPAVSPLRGSHEGLCPLLVLVGGLECFRRDVRELVARVHKAGGTAELVEGLDAVHCWYLEDTLPGPDDTQERIVRQIRDWL